MTNLDHNETQNRFSEIFYRYRKQMLLTAINVLQDQHEAEDAVQIAFEGIARNLQNIPSDDPARERAYILTSVRNAAIKLSVKRKHVDTSIDISNINISSATDPFDMIVRSSDYARLLKAIRALPRAYREVLFMVYVEDLTVQQAAVVLHRKTDTVYKQLRRGKARLLEICVKEGIIREE